MTLFDSHVHLNDMDLYPIVEEVIQASVNDGTSYFMVPGYDKASCERALSLANQFSNVYCALGFHPSEAKNIAEEDMKWLEANLHHEKVKAIGEIGLDYYWDSSYKDIQKKLFIQQIEFANQTGLPIIVHMRDANQDTLEVIQNHKAKGTRGIMHCYSGSLEMAKQFIHENMMISLGGPVTFKNAKVPKEVAHGISIEHLLIETDSPYLAPTPFRGKQNQPKYLKYIAQEIASIKGMNVDEFTEKVFQNTMSIFKIK